MTSQLAVGQADLAAQVLTAGGSQPRITVTVYKGRGTERRVTVTGATNDRPIRYGQPVRLVVQTSDPPATVLSKIWLRGYRSSTEQIKSYAATATFTADQP